jgi:hypothetical protein
LKMQREFVHVPRAMCGAAPHCSYLICTF